MSAERIRRCCIGCGHVYTGPVNCPNCPEVGEPLRGRPAKGRKDWKAHVDASWALDERLAALFPHLKDRGDRLLAVVQLAEAIRSQYGPTITVDPAYAHVVRGEDKGLLINILGEEA